jgi:phytoene dehydrogenase-like protein
MERRDVVVVGGGHNGLVAANYLVDAGRDVLVVEARDDVGGMCSSGTPIDGAPDHVVNFGAGDLAFWPASPVERELELAKYGLRTVVADPNYAYLHPDGASLALWKDPRRTADDIRRFSAADADAYLEYARMLDGLFDIALPYMLGNLARPDLGTMRSLLRGSLKQRKRLGEFAAFMLATGEEVIDSRFKHPVTQALLYALVAGAQPIDAVGSSAPHLLLAFLHRHGSSRPVGGMQAIPAALAKRLKSKGGSVLTGCSVSEIIIEGGRAAGVALSDGRVVKAPTVLLAIDPRSGLGDLLPAGTLSPTLEARVRHIPANAGGWGQMKVDLAFSGPLRLDRHHAQRSDGLDLRIPCGLIGEPDSIRRAYTQSAAGEVPAAQDIVVWTIVNNALDPTMAPPGGDSMYVYVPTMPSKPPEGWELARDRAADAVVEQVASCYDGVKELEINRWVATPADIAERWGATNGAVLHVDVVLTRSGPLRPALGLGGIRLPVPGLFLGASGAHPGGGVTGLPGRLAAREILRRPPRRERAAR